MESTLLNGRLWWIGKRAAEQGVVANLCTPDHFILVVNLYHRHRFYFETRGHCSMRAWGVWFRPDQTTFILPRTTSNPSIHEIFTPPPPPPPPVKYQLYDGSIAWTIREGQYRSSHCPERQKVSLLYLLSIWYGLIHQMTKHRVVILLLKSITLCWITLHYIKFCVCIAPWCWDNSLHDAVWLPELQLHHTLPSDSWRR